MSLTRRLLTPVAELREDEGPTALLMFLSSFCAIAGYNVIKPITRSAFIKDLGADNLPWMPLATAFLIAGLMGGYTWIMQRLPRRWGLPIAQASMAVLLVVFWFLFQTEGRWVAAAFYVWGLLMGVLLTSQFWTVANVIYDARQAKRLFGFIGAGAPLGGAAAGWLGTKAAQIGTYNLILYSAVIMVASATAIALVLARERHVEGFAETTAAEKGVGAAEALRLLRSSRHLQIIALVIMFAAIGAQVIEQQLNMAAEATKGRGDVDAITAFLSQVLLWMSLAAFVIQAFLTSRIHRFLGIGFALFILPMGLGSTAVLMLLNGALWAPGLARILDQSLRYTVDKTTREVLFLPLPTALKLQAKPFVDVTVDRFGKGLSALLLLVLVQDWGLGLNWQQISYASLAITGLWIFAAIAAKRGYLTAFRRSIERREVDPATSPVTVADLSTVETLVEELAHDDEQRVLYAIDVLEALDKRNLITPLLLRHESAAVRVRALGVLGRARPEVARRWEPSIQRMLSDPSADVRAAAFSAIAALRGERATDLARPLLTDSDPRIVVSAATILADSPVPADVRAAEAALAAVTGDPRAEAAAARRDLASAIRHIRNPQLRGLVIPLLYDSDPVVSEEAMRSVGSLGASDFLFVPTLVALLRHRRLKAAARDVLVAYGPQVLDTLAHFMRDPEEDPWVRRHLPATIARIGTPRAVDILVEALGDSDGFLRYKAIEALERLRHQNDTLQFPREPIERLLLGEARRYFAALTTHHSLFVRQRTGAPDGPPLLFHALNEKCRRSLDRMYRLLSLLYPWKDIDAARWALEHGDSRAKSSASEYLDNVLAGSERKRVLPALEAMPLDEKVRRGYVLLRSRPRTTEETLLELINDEDQVIAAAAIDLVREIGEWRLKDDIEHVLAHRDVRDWYVFEAASWALAAHRLGDERRRELWREPLPATELAARLRRLAPFSSVGIDELFRLAGAGRQSRLEPGKVLVQEGTPPEAVHILLDGRVTSRRKGAPGKTIDAPAALGLRETLQGSTAPATIRTEGPVVTLAIAPDDLRTLIADTSDLIDGFLRTLAEQEAAASRAPLVVRGGAPADLLALAADGVAPISKILLLQRLPLFSAVSADEIRQVAGIARELRIEATSELAAEGQAPAIYYVLTGELRAEPPRESAGPGNGGAAQAVGPGDALGVFETLAGRPLGRTVHATRSGVALKIDRRDLIDQLGQRPVLVQQVFASLFDILEEAEKAGY
ncbi:MAG TPA: Npt1/Npt2 family nucleotide transporter [Vicinamibacterales bacterium]|nr:Npt1/Npt2 family nucleotide transporter [Vicinamibacterales bacterium]